MRFAHVFETTLDDVRSNGRLSPTQDVLKIMLRAPTSWPTWSAPRGRRGVDEARSRGLVEELEALASGEVPALRPRRSARGQGRTGTDRRLRLCANRRSAFDDFDDERSGRRRQRLRRHRSSRARSSTPRPTTRRCCCASCRASARSSSIATPMRCRRSTGWIRRAPTFAWTVTLKRRRARTPIRAVFEFVDWRLRPGDPDVGRNDRFSRSAEELPMVPVPFDASILDSSDCEDDAENEGAAMLPWPAPRFQPRKPCRRLLSVPSAASRAEKKRCEG